MESDDVGKLMWHLDVGRAHSDQFIDGLVEQCSSTMDEFAEVGLGADEKDYDTLTLGLFKALMDKFNGDVENIALLCGTLAVAVVRLLKVRRNVSQVTQVD